MVLTDQMKPILVVLFIGLSLFLNAAPAQANQNSLERYVELTKSLSKLSYKINTDILPDVQSTLIKTKTLEEILKSPSKINNIDEKNPPNIARKDFKNLGRLFGAYLSVRDIIAEIKTNHADQITEDSQAHALAKAEADAEQNLINIANNFKTISDSYLTHPDFFIPEMHDPEIIGEDSPMQELASLKQRAAMNVFIAFYFGIFAATSPHGAQMFGGLVVVETVLAGFKFFKIVRTDFKSKQEEFLKRRAEKLNGPWTNFAWAFLDGMADFFEPDAKSFDEQTQQILMLAQDNECKAALKTK